MFQVDKNTIELSERRHFSQIPPILSPFISESVSFFDIAKRGVRHTVSNVEPPEAPKALDVRNAQKKQTAPLVREFPPTSLDALPGNGTSASSPSGEDTQGPSLVDYSLEIEQNSCQRW